MENQSQKAKFKKLRDDRIDLAIIAKGGISLYYSPSIFDYDIQLLSAKGYKIIQFNDRVITTAKELHLDLQNKLGFPGYYGRNFDALNDCMRDYEITDIGDVLVFPKLDHLDSRSIYDLLDIFSLHCRRNIAIGKKLLILIQVDNPKFIVKEPIGSLNFWLWNDEEWFEADRR